MPGLVTYEDLANDLIDFYVDMYGHKEAIRWLIDEGCDRYQICSELGFDEAYYDEIMMGRC